MSHNVRVLEQEQAIEAKRDRWHAERVAQLAEIDEAPEYAEVRSTYRPDETDDLNDMAAERDWERSAEEWERYG